MMENLRSFTCSVTLKVLKSSFSVEEDIIRLDERSFETLSASSFLDSIGSLEVLIVDVGVGLGGHVGEWLRWKLIVLITPLAKPHTLFSLQKFTPSFKQISFSFNKFCLFINNVFHLWNDEWSSKFCYVQIFSLPPRRPPPPLSPTDPWCLSENNTWIKIMTLTENPLLCGIIHGGVLMVPQGFLTQDS